MGIAKGIEYAEKFTSVATSHTTTVGQVTQATGSTIVLWEIGGASASTLTTPTDNKTNTYVAGAAQVTAASGAQCRWWYCENALGGAGHTWTCASSSDVRSVFVLEIKQGLTSGIVDQATAGVSDVVSPYTSNTTGTTAQANEMIVAMVATDSVSGTEVITWGGGFTQSTAVGDANFATGGLATQISSATGTFTSSITSAGAGTTGAVSFVATFKEAAATDVLMAQILT